MTELLNSNHTTKGYLPAIYWCCLCGNPDTQHVDYWPLGDTVKIINWHCEEWDYLSLVSTTATVQNSMLHDWVLNLGLKTMGLYHPYPGEGPTLRSTHSSKSRKREWLTEVLNKMWVRYQVKFELPWVEWKWLRLHQSPFTLSANTISFHSQLISLGLLAVKVSSGASCIIHRSQRTFQIAGCW